ncbi:MAG: hypothetical protein BGP03_11020 [Pseudonocardia sp. 73-21]|nr:MAG: hypothetical protein BGP03_11020 [Pseudonocardia sp. 73-21]
MDEMVTVVAPTCPVCRHPFGRDRASELLAHVPADCGYRCCRDMPPCFSCRTPFCICAIH